MSDMEKNAPSTTTPRPSIQVASPSMGSSSGKERRLSCSSVDSLKKGSPADSSRDDGATQKVVLSKEEDDDDRDDRDGAAAKPRRPGKTGRVLLPATTILILAWWASSLILPATRHRWYVPFQSSRRGSCH